MLLPSLQCLPRFNHQQDGRESQEGKSEKTHGFRKRQLIKESKSHMHKQSKSRNSPLPSGRCSAIPRKAGPYHVQQRLGKTKPITPNMPQQSSLVSLLLLGYMIIFSVKTDGKKRDCGCSQFPVAEEQIIFLCFSIYYLCFLLSVVYK